MVRLMEFMGIIIFEVKYESNKYCFQELFLKELYPSGLVDDMLIVYSPLVWQLRH